MNILIVDDDLLYALQLEAMLSELGYTVSGHATNYQQAIDLIETNHVDLLVTDIVLAGSKNGLDLVEAISSLYIPTILMTAHDTPEIYEKVSVLNHVLYLVKPFHIHTLDSSIRLVSQCTSSKEPQFIRGTTRGEVIALKDILYIEVERTYTFIQTSARRYAFKKSLTLLKQQLPLGKFLQIHRSFLVQKKFIKRIDFEKSVVELEGHTLPLSRRVKHDIQSKNISENF